MKYQKSFKKSSFRDHPLFMAGKGLGDWWGLQCFLKTGGLGVLNMKLGGVQIFPHKIWWALHFCLYHQKNNCYHDDTDKRSEGLS